MTEIKDLKEKSQKEDDVLLSISAGYRQPIVPHFEYEYLDRTIHEDLFKLVQFSCEEICSSKDQISKVLRLWTNFLELMLGVPPRDKGSDSVEDVAETKHHGALTSGDEYASSGVSKHGGTGLLNRDSSAKDNCKDADTASKDMATCSAVNPQKDLETGNGADKRSGDVDERVVTSSASFPSGVENNNGKVGSGDPSGIFRIELYFSSSSSVCVHYPPDGSFTFTFKVHLIFYPNRVTLPITLTPFSVPRYSTHYHILVICVYLSSQLFLWTLLTILITHGLIARLVILAELQL